MYVQQKIPSEPFFILWTHKNELIPPVVASLRLLHEEIGQLKMCSTTYESFSSIIADLPQPRDYAWSCDSGLKAGGGRITWLYVIYKAHGNAIWRTERVVLVVEAIRLPFHRKDWFQLLPITCRGAGVCRYLANHRSIFGYWNPSDCWLLPDVRDGRLTESGSQFVSFASYYIWPCNSGWDTKNFLFIFIFFWDPSPLTKEIVISVHRSTNFHLHTVQVHSYVLPRRWSE